MRFLAGLFLAALTLHATAYTSTGGNWNTSATWVPPGIPGSGDTAKLTGAVVIPNGYTATIGTCPVNANAMAGTGTIDLEIVPGGSLTVNTGGTYKLQGFQQHTGVYMATTNIPAFTMQTGSTLQIDECNGSVPYGLYPQVSNPGGFSFITVGTIGDKAATSGTVITSIRNGSANGIFWQDNNAFAVNAFKAYGVSFSNCGDASNRCAVWDLFAPNGALESFNIFDLEESTFTNTGGIGGGKSGEMLNDNQAVLKIHNNFFTGTTWNASGIINTVGISSDQFTPALSPPGNFELSGNFLDKGIGPDPAGGAGAVLSQWNIFGNVINGWYVSGNAYPSGTGWVGFHDNLVRYADSTSTAELYGGGTNIYFYNDTSVGSPSNPHIAGLPNSVTWQTGNVFSKWVWDYGDNGTEGNCMGTDSVPDVSFDHNVVVYTPFGRGSCTLYDWGTSATAPLIGLTNNTVAGGISYGGVFYIGETGSPAAKGLASYFGNLYFDSSTRSNAVGFASQDTTMAANLMDPAAMDYNTNWNAVSNTIFGVGHNSNCSPSSALNTPYVICTTTTIPGTHDLNVNPRMVDTTRNMRKWAGLHGQAATADGAIAAFLAGGVTQLPTLFKDLMSYVRTGYSPTNLALKNRGHDSLDIGAVPITIYNSVQ